MSAVEETTELEHTIRDQTRRLENLHEQLRKAQYGHQEDGVELVEARARAGFYRNNYAFSKRRQTDLVDFAEFLANRTSMQEAWGRVEDLRSSIASNAAKVERLENLVRQCELTLQIARARLKKYGQLVHVDFTRKRYD